MESYKPSKKILERYADVLVNFALGKGKGIKKGDVVYVVAYEYSKPLYAEILKAIMKAGGNAISQYMPNSDREFNITRDFYVNAKEHQINFFPSKYIRGIVDEIHHYLFILSDTDMETLKGVDSKKIMKRSKVMKTFRDWRNEKENKGNLSWTTTLYGTAAMAKEAGLSERAYWNQIINACFLNHANPVKKWKSIDSQIRSYARKLTNLRIEKLHIKGPDADLWITPGKKRVWESGGGANIPSFEIFTSPDWRGTNGWMKFNNPVYTYGNLITGISLKFKKGIVIEARAKKNQKLLTHMINSPNGNKIGEFSLTDRRFSKITRFMAETLYDENIGGPNGNTHIAIGNSYQSCYAGNPNKLKKNDWKHLGFNDSPIHEDIVSTTPRTVTAYLKNNRRKTIYKNGEFVI